VSISIPTNQLEAALYAALNVAGITTLATNGVHNSLGRDANGKPAEPPFVVFSVVDPGRHRYTFGDNRYAVDYMYLVKGITEGVATALAGQIDAAIDTALHGVNLNISGYGTMLCRRVTDVSYPEDDQGRTFRHRGGVYAVSING